MNFRLLFRRKKNDRGDLIKTLSSTALWLASRRIGAIIVIERNVELGDILEKGVKIDAVVTQDLLSTIFFPNTALHDGAVIIGHGDRIVAAGCVLPLANLARQHFGTRHRAAIGITESTDAVSLIVSEETGIISMSREGKLTRYLDTKSLNILLTELFTPDRTLSSWVAQPSGKEQKNED